MKKIFLIICLLVSNLAIYSQDCFLYEKQYEEFKVNYNKAKRINEKKYWLNQMDITLKDAKENQCGLADEKKKELKRFKKELSDLLNKDSDALPTTENINADGEPISIKHKKGMNVLEVSIPDWLKVQDTDDFKTFEVSADKNILPHSRECILEVEDGKKRHNITIRQEAAQLEANVTEHIGYGQDGGAAFIFIETNDTAWSVLTDTKGKNWLSTELTNYGAKVVCTPNPTKKRRSAQVKVRFACGESRNVEISQAIGKTTLSVPHKSYTFDYNGGLNNNVSVECNYDQWSASSNASWITVKKKYGGVSIECTPNRIASTRTATVTIETNDEDHLVEYIGIKQEEAPAYITAERDSYHSDGYEHTIDVKVNTNIPNWNATVDKGRSWTTVKQFGDYAKVSLERNDCNYSRISEVRLYGKGKSYLVSFSQPNRGYLGRYKDYYDAKGGDWHITWASIDFHALTTVGNNFSFVNARWKPVELSLLNFNLDYIIDDGFSASWEPVIRGFVPISRDGKWAAYAGMGGHICMSGGWNYFLLEFGTEVQWNKKRSSRIFFKYNGGCSLGMSLDFGKWIK